MGDYTLVIGSSNLDIKGRLLNPAIPGSSNSARVRTAHGGVGRNIAENLARLGSEVVLLTVVGDDNAGDELLDALETQGVDVSRALRVADTPTGVYLAALDHTGDLMVGLDDLEIAQRMTASYLSDNADAFFDCDMVVLDLNLSDTALERALELGRTAGKPICVDPTTDERAVRLVDYLSEIDIITPNMTEAEAILEAACKARPDLVEALSHIQDPDRALQTARRLVYLGVNTVVVTQAERGACYATEFESGHFPAVKVDIVDTTGAGDSLTATLVFGLTHEIGLSDAVQLGLRAAAMTLRESATVAPGMSLDALYSGISQAGIPQEP
ncbi:MAG: carbohydrate kinase family protein [Thermoflexales bacterium]|nr:carbohydrate kinase family protein [Thermoflexales bacterium]